MSTPPHGLEEIGIQHSIQHGAAGKNIDLCGDTKLVDMETASFFFYHLSILSQPILHILHNSFFWQINYKLFGSNKNDSIIQLP
jgi:hypothetical protein